MQLHRSGPLKAWVFAMVLPWTFITHVAEAGEECKDPIANWQSRQLLKNRLEAQGWQVQHIRIEHSCYEVHAIDSKQRKVKAVFTPAAFTLLALTVKHYQQRP